MKSFLIALVYFVGGCWFLVTSAAVFNNFLDAGWLFFVMGSMDFAVALYLLDKAIDRFIPLIQRIKLL